MKDYNIYKILTLIIPLIPQRVFAKEESAILNNLTEPTTILEPVTLKYLILILIIVILIITSSILFGKNK